MSKVETGSKPPSTDLARRCDAALSCGGGLAKLTPFPVVDAPVRATGDLGEVWVLSMDEHGNNEFRAVSRRDLIVGGVAGLAGLAVAAHRPDGEDRWSLGNRHPDGAPALDGGTVDGENVDGENVAAFRIMFDQLRGLGQRVAPAMLVPVLVAQTHSLRLLAGRARPAERVAALVLAARFAEYTGWMMQESGDDARAAWWTDRAVDLASAVGDREMAAYALVRRALITLYRNDAAETIELAQAAQAASHDPRIRGLAAQREAQGHALAGDDDACSRAMDRAAGLLALAPGTDGGPVIGTSHVSDPVAAATGWCLYDLGQPARAAGILRRELDRIPPQAEGARARYGARLSLALAGCGEPEEACASLESVLDVYEKIDSATIRMDLSSLSRVLARWHGNPQVRETRLRLTTALYTGPRGSGS